MSATGEVYALLVGINDYKCEAVRKLQFAVADVLAFREFLRERMGIKPQNCTILSNPVPWKNDLLGELDAFSNHPMGSDDTFILYFAGHGFALDGASYLLTFESDPSSADLLEDTAIPLSRIARYLRRHASWPTTADSRRLPERALDTCPRYRLVLYGCGHGPRYCGHDKGKGR